MASVTIAVSLGLLHAIVSEGGVAKTIDILAQKTGSEPSFLGTRAGLCYSLHGISQISLGRIARHLAAEKLILETGPSEYAPTAATHMLTSPAMEGMTKIMSVQTLLAKPIH